jgi:plastocyanin
MAPQPQTWTIKIEQAPGQTPATFNPSSLTVAPGDLIFWSNHTSDPHWPAPAGQAESTWFEYQIPGKLPGQPAPTSPQISFASATTISYVCALNPQMTGTITVS